MKISYKLQKRILIKTPDAARTHLVNTVMAFENWRLFFKYFFKLSNALQFQCSPINNINNTEISHTATLLWKHEWQTERGLCNCLPCHSYLCTYSTILVTSILCFKKCMYKICKVYEKYRNPWGNYVIKKIYSCLIFKENIALCMGSTLRHKL